MLYDRRRGAAASGSAITQNDVRAIQLAKAALYAGVRLLMDELGVEQVDDVRLAGAFGSQIDVFHAMVLGLDPGLRPAQRVVGRQRRRQGALIALLSARGPRRDRDVVRPVQKVETAVEPRFQEHFVEAMALPHGPRPPPNLSRCVDLPAPSAADVPDARRDGGDARPSSPIEEAAR